MMTDPFAGISSENITELFDLRFPTSVPFRVEKIKDRQRLKDLTDWIREVKSEELERIVHNWQHIDREVDGGFLSDHYYLTTFLKEVEDYLDTYTHLLVASKDIFEIRRKHLMLGKSLKLF